MTEIISTPVASKRKRLVVAGLAAVVVCAGIAGASVSSTGAWFTATKTASSNSVTAGTLSLGNIGDGANGIVTATNIYPMTDAQAQNAATAGVPEAVINLRNTGTLPLDYSVTLANLVVKASTANGGATLANTNVKVSLWNGTAWGTPTTLASLVSSTPGTLASTNAFNPGTDLAAGANASLRLRVYFDGATTTDAYQGASISFDATAKAIQTNQQ